MENILRQVIFLGLIKMNVKSDYLKVLMRKENFTDDI